MADRVGIGAAKRAGFIGIWRKPLILAAFVNFWQLLSTFVGKKIFYVNTYRRLAVR
jgi:hypothetical protein